MAGDKPAKVQKQRFRNGFHVRAEHTTFLLAVNRIRVNCIPGFQRKCNLEEDPIRL